MRTAAAEIPRQRFFDLAVGRFGIFIQQGFARHDHAVDAVATLGRLLIDEGLLNFVHLLGRAQAFERSNRFILHRAHRSDTGADGIAVHDDRACAALSETAAEFRPVQPEIVTESVEQRHIGLGLDRLIFAIHAERYFCHVNTPLELLRARANFQRSFLIIGLGQATRDEAAVTWYAIATALKFNQRSRALSWRSRRSSKNCAGVALFASGTVSERKSRMPCMPDAEIIRSRRKPALRKNS